MLLRVLDLDALYPQGLFALLAIESLHAKHEIPWDCLQPIGQRKLDLTPIGKQSHALRVLSESQFIHVSHWRGELCGPEGLLTGYDRHKARAADGQVESALAEATPLARLTPSD